MIYLFVPYYTEDTPEFRQSLESQIVPFQEIRRNRKADKICWTKAVNDFRKELMRYRGLKDDDVVCIMNNDISFGEKLFEEGSEVALFNGNVYIPEGININWKTKSFNKTCIRINVDSFAGRCFFMTVRDFIDSGGFSKLLPHCLSDLDFGLRMIKKGSDITIMVNNISHCNHNQEMRPFKIHSQTNPIFWTIFLLKHFNKYTFLNITKAWVDAWRYRNG